MPTLKTMLVNKISDWLIGSGMCLRSEPIKKLPLFTKAANDNKNVIFYEKKTHPFRFFDPKIVIDFGKR